MRTTLPLLLALCGPLAAWSQPTASTGSLLTPKDSILLTVDNSQKLIHHIVKPKQTLFSLAKFYGLSLEELFALHPEFQADPVLRVGTLISIPIPNRAIRRYKGTNFESAQFAPIYYVVQPGDNLFQICKRHFNMPVDSVKTRNNLTTDQLKPGQLLHVGWMGLEGISAEWRTPAAPPTTDQAHQQRFDEEKKDRKEVTTQGVCFWQKDSNEKGDLYALHREAAVGSVMAVTNPMSRRTVYAKVIGRIPAGHASNIEVVLSPAAARQIGARDSRFFVKVRFLK